MEKQKYQAYLSATQTVAKTKQIVLLYDGAIRFMKQAKEALRENRIEDRYNLLTKTNEILNGLQASLDFEKGGEIAKLLYSFYTNVELKVFSIHRTKSMETCDEVIADLKQMRDAWHEIDASADDAAIPPAPNGDASNGSGGEPPQNITLSA